MAAMPTVLALMAHPDDAEILCGGTLLVLAGAGWKIHIATMTAGDCGSSTLGPQEIARVRRAEGARAASILGGAFHCLEHKDLEVFYERESLGRACSLLRRVEPDVVITHSPCDYMLDHEETSRVARAACFNAPIPNAPAADGSVPIRAIPALYYADPVEGVDALGRPIPPRFVVDVADVVERKAAALACHSSQREWLRAQHGIDEYLDSMRSWGAERGRLAGVEHGEGFRQHLGHAYPREDRLRAALGARVHALCDEPERPSTPERKR